MEKFNITRVETCLGIGLNFASLMTFKDAVYFLITSLWFMDFISLLPLLQCKKGATYGIDISLCVCPALVNSNAFHTLTNFINIFYLLKNDSQLYPNSCTVTFHSLVRSFIQSVFFLLTSCSLSLFFFPSFFLSFSHAVFL